MSKNQTSKPVASSKPAFKPSTVVDPNGVVLGTVQYLEPTDPKPAAPVATTPVAAAPSKSRFVRTMEEQVAAYVAGLKLAKVPADLQEFAAWSKANPPAEKVAAPAGDSATGRVWAYCDQMKAGGKVFTRKEVIDALTAQGLNPATVSTQYQRWSKARGGVAA